MSAPTETPEVITTNYLIETLRERGMNEAYSYLTGALSVFVTQDNLQTILRTIDIYFPKESK